MESKTRNWGLKISRSYRCLRMLVYGSEQGSTNQTSMMINLGDQMGTGIITNVIKTEDTSNAESWPMENRQTKTLVGILT